MNILHSDSHIIVVDKPGGLLAVPGRGHDKQDCVVSRIRLLFPDIIPQPAVHRLDLHTTGIMVLAKTKEAHRELSRQFEKREIDKSYTALLERPINGQGGRIELQFRLDVDNRPYQIYDPIHGKIGITEWKKIGETNGFPRIEFRPLTGRTHQLRLHAAHPLGLAAPIIGDHLYGSGRDGDRMLLHATSLHFIHPHSGESIVITSLPGF